MLELFIKYRPKDELGKKLLRLSIFLWNLSIYSIPLFLMSKGFITLPKGILNFYAKFIETLIKFFGIAISREENILILNDFSFVITQDCIGYKSFLGLFAIIFATPIKDFKIKAKYFLLFSPIVIIANVLRIFTTLIFYYYFNIDPKFLHDVIWMFLVSGLVVSLWIIYFIKNKDYVVI